MNRLHHLKETLPKNIENNLDYDNVEFVILDYSSNDAIQEWLLWKMKDHLDSGLIKYFRHENQPFFKRAHSRNMAMKMATGDIVVNLDADNYTGEGFATYINNHFNENINSFLRINYKDPEVNRYFKDSLGRVCVRKSDFIQVGGYDEGMEGYGHEDQDLYYRLEQLGCEKVYFNSTKYLHSISHSREERMQNEKDANRFKRLLVSYLDQSTTQSAFLFDDGTFEAIQIVPSFYHFYAPASIVEGSLKKGTYKDTKEGVVMNLDGKEILLSHSGRDLYAGDFGSGRIKEITNERYLNEFKLQFSVMKNAHKHHLNRTNNVLNPNGESFGEGDLFDMEHYATQLISA